jgi:hypothetical protein
LPASRSEWESKADIIEKVWLVERKTREEKVMERRSAEEAVAQ